MRKLAFIFPGQGAQKVGMGFELFQTYPIARETFDEADATLARSLSQLCFAGPAETLRQTENTQLAMLVCSIAGLRVLSETGISPSVVAGHSLGEYSALVAANVLAFSDALKLVKYRAEFMAAASQQQACSMAAVLGLETEVLQALCEKEQAQGIVSIANYNCPGQLIISGEAGPVEAVIQQAKEAGAKRCLTLPVSGAFHSQLMLPARDRLEAVIGDFTFHPPQTELVANVTGAFVQNVAQIPKLLTEQVTSPVQWEKSIRTIADERISYFVEIGPGQVLSGMVRRILTDATCLNVADAESLEKTISVIT